MIKIITDDLNMNESITSSFVFGFLTVQAIFLYKPFKYLFRVVVIS